MIKRISKSLYLRFSNPNIQFMSRVNKPTRKPFYKQQRSPEVEENKKNSAYLYIGMCGLVFGCCFAGIPLYRVFCEHMGLVGNYDKKEYDFKSKKIANMKKYIVKFQGQPQPGIDWEFVPIEKQVHIGAAETSIVFYRLYNREDKPIVGFSTYNIYPEQANVYFSKIQCFCFNQQMINPKQQLLLPLFFYLQPQINDDPDVSRIKQIRVNYQFLKSNKQDLAVFAQNQLNRIQDNKKKLNTIRAKKRNLTLQQYEELIQNQQQHSAMEIALRDQLLKAQEYQQKQSKSNTQSITIDSKLQSQIQKFNIENSPEIQNSPVEKANEHYTQPKSQNNSNFQAANQEV